MIDVEFTSLEHMTIKANDYAISCGVDIDELSELLKTHQEAIFERTWEQTHNHTPNPYLTGFEDVVQLKGENNGDSKK